MGVLCTHCRICGGRLDIAHRGDQVITFAKHPTIADCFRAMVEGNGKADEVVMEYDVTTLTEESPDAFRMPLPPPAPCSQ
jgi:hypothetical protein